MVKVLQGNMHRSRLAHDLLTQIILEHNADIIIISEQYRNKDTPTWYSDNLGTAAIWVPDSQRVHVDSHGCGDGFIWIKSKGITYVSCYFTPNERIDIFRARMDRLEDVIQTMDAVSYTHLDVYKRQMF